MRSYICITSIAIFFVVATDVFAIRQESAPEALDQNPNTQSLQRFEHDFPAMGVRFRLVAFDKHQAHFRSVAEKIEQHVKRLDSIFSDYNSNSEINLLSRSAPHSDPVAVSSELFRLCLISDRIYKSSGGAFDPSIGALSSVWRMARKRNRLPNRQKLAVAFRDVGWSKVHWNAEGRIRLTSAGTRFDFGGIAKGFAADEAITIFKRNQITSALVDASGDICVSNPPPGKAGWLVNIEPGLANVETPVNKTRLTLSIANCGLATSGDSNQSLTINGIRYSHIIDPRTGNALTNSCTVTIIAGDGATADGLASAASVLGVEDGKKLIGKSPNAFGRFERKIDRNQIDETMTRGFRKFIVNDLFANPAARLGN